MIEEVNHLFCHFGEDDAYVSGAIEDLADRFGDEVFQEALRQLSGQEFDRETARAYWQGAIRHRQRMCRGRDPHLPLRPALLDYLHRQVRVLRDPRIVEADQLREIWRASVSDGLTGLFHQTYFKTFLDKEIARRQRQEKGLFALVLLDLDHFKQYNDRSGHLAGDQALRQVAQILRDHVREGDVVARYGGEEFALFLAGVDRRQAFKVAERIRRAVAEYPFPHQERLDSGSLTLSGGMALFPEDGNDATVLINHADQELYRAKILRNTISPATHDRRRDFRHRVRSLLEIAPAEVGSFRSGLAFECSERGLTLGSADSFLPGTVLQVRFSRPFWSRDGLFLATVRHVRRDPASGVYFLGLEFTPPGADPELWSERSHPARQL